MTIDWNAIILAIVAAAPVVIGMFLNRKSVPPAAAQALADSVPSDVANKMADCLPPATPPSTNGTQPNV